MALQNALGVSPLVTTLGGTGTATNFTSGSLVFADTSGVYTQDNSNLFWDNSNKRLGIGGAIVPSNTLTVRGASYFSQEVTIAGGGLAIAAGTTLHFASLSTGVLHANSTGIISSSTVVNADLAAGSFTNITGVGTLTAGTWQASVIGAQYGGTGTANLAGSTITLGGKLQTTGAFDVNFTLTAGTSVTLPTSGTILSTANASGNYVSSITGTANQVIASAATGAVTLSLPQSIATTSNVNFGSVSVSTAATTPLSSYSNVASTTPFGSTNQFNLLCQNDNSTNNNWQFIVFNNSSGNVSTAIGTQITNQTTGESTLNLYTKSSGGVLTNQAVIASTGVVTLTQPLPATSGGTGFASYAVGDILYASTTTALSKLADVATGNALISGGVNTAPSWGKIGLTTHVSGTLGVGNGGTGTATTFTQGSVVFAGASGIYTQDTTSNGQFYWDATNHRLGIGTTSPAQTVHLSSSSSNEPTLTIENTNADDLAPNIKFYKIGGSAAANDQIGTIYFNGQNSTPSPNIRYGDITCVSTVVTASSEEGQFIIRTAVAGTATRTFSITGANVAVGNASATHVFQLTGSDDAAKTTTTLWTVTSDSRIKRNIRDVEEALPIINALRPRKFNYIPEFVSDKKELNTVTDYYGFVADEVEAVMSSCVKTGRGKVDTDPMNPIENLKELNPHNMVVLLFKAVQELSSEITRIKSAVGISDA